MGDLETTCESYTPEISDKLFMQGGLLMNMSFN